MAAPGSQCSSSTCRECRRSATRCSWDSRARKSNSGCAPAWPMRHEGVSRRTCPLAATEDSETCRLTRRAFALTWSRLGRALDLLRTALAGASTWRVMRHMDGSNLALVFMRQATNPDRTTTSWPHACWCRIACSTAPRRSVCGTPVRDRGGRPDDELVAELPGRNSSGCWSGGMTRRPESAASFGSRGRVSLDLCGGAQSALSAALPHAAGHRLPAHSVAGRSADTFRETGASSEKCTWRMPTVACARVRTDLPIPLNQAATSPERWTKTCGSFGWAATPCCTAGCSNAGTARWPLKIVNICSA